MTAIEHPYWCDPTFCTAPAEQPTEYTAEGRVFTAHHSIPVEIGVTTFDVFTSSILYGPLFGKEGGVFAWLTQAVAPWKCTTFVRIGLYQPSVGAPEPLLSVPMEPRNTISSRYPMSAGERLWHLCTHALEVKGVDEFGFERHGQYGEVAE